MTFGLTVEKIMLISLIAVILIGPERLPIVAEGAGRFLRALKELAIGSKERLRAEIGEEFDQVDWSKIDPRQYDPRKIVRDVFNEEQFSNSGSEKPE